MEAFRGEQVDVIISTGQKFDVRKLKNVPVNVHIYKSVPQLTVLKMADVFVTHGGMNSVSEALVYGTPMVVIPFVSDQPVNARCVETLGVGKKLAYEEVTSQSLRQTVLEVRNDEKIKKHIKEVQKLIEEAPGNRGGAEFIVDFVGGK